MAAWVGAISSAHDRFAAQEGARRANKRAVKLAREQMAFQERMSNTAVQRRMEDMKLAGINPILAGRMEASSPGGQTAPVMSELGAGVSASQAARGLALQFAKNRAEIDNIKAGTAKTRATTEIMSPWATAAENINKFLEGIVGEQGDAGQAGIEKLKDVAKDVASGKRHLYDPFGTGQDKGAHERNKARVRKELKQREWQLEYHSSTDYGPTKKWLRQQIADLKRQLLLLEDPQ